MIAQLVYISTATPGVAPDIAAILQASQANNRRDGLTGLLFFNGKRFLQVLEGQGDAVDRTIARIRADDRHRAMVVLSHRQVNAREFGAWAMADATTIQDTECFFADLDRLVANAAPAVKATFDGYARMARAA